MIVESNFSMRYSVKFLLPLLLAPTLIASPAHSGSCLLSNLAACNLTENNIQFSDFSFTGFTANPLDRFTFTANSNGNRGGSVTLLFDPVRDTSVGGSFTYTATLLPSPLFTYTFQDVTPGAQATFFEPGSTLSSSVASSGLIGTATLSKSGTGSTSTAPAVFQPQLTSQIFTQSFDLVSVNNDSLASIGATWRAKANPVPGPLPLLGAATAIGLSRKLRSRIRSAA
jgi:hypothetical protein